MDSNSQYYDMGSDILNRKVKELEEKLAKTKEQPTLRDQFAMAALTGILASSTGIMEDRMLYAAVSYSLANAMMAMREDK